MKKIIVTAAQRIRAKVHTARVKWADSKVATTTNEFHRARLRFHANQIDAQEYGKAIEELHHAQAKRGRLGIKK
jgi:hypothetical protein